MNKSLLKYIFFILAGCLLPVLLFTSSDAGISGDEEVHYLHSEMVYKFFATMGADKSALNTPVTHLQYYGQAFDNLVTIFIHWFSVEDIYGFRHIMSSIAGWLAIVSAGFLAVFLGGYFTGIITLILLAASPTFLGHVHNNLKDIPFALAYVASVYFIAKSFFNGVASKWSKVLLTLSVALAIGIRPGGLLVIAYLVFFVLLGIAYQQWLYRNADWKAFRKTLVHIALISAGGYLGGLILWPYALQNPLVNPWKSYQVMTHFPTTIRQIFEGDFIWSDLLPWYYLPKSMLITIPLAVWAGLALFVVLAWKNIGRNSAVLYIFICFAVFFPPLFAIIKNANLYGSWRHFLFIYPVLVVLAALGFQYFLNFFKNRFMSQLAMVLLLILMTLHPVRFMVRNHPYYYLYYNQFAGGLKNAYGNYETDYYYHSVREATNWLVKYLGENNVTQAVIGSNFSVAWHLRENKSLSPVYFSWGNRSEKNWDYAIIANSYIPPHQLKNGIWPPVNTIHTILVDSIPVCAVLKRTSKADLEGIEAFRKGDYDQAAMKLKEAAQIDSLNETIFYYWGLALQKSGNLPASDSLLQQSLKLHPQHELTLIALGRNAGQAKNKELAASYYDRLLEANPKFFRGYFLRAALFTESEADKARTLLKACLRLNPKYVPAITALADTYRESDPEIARKYDKLAKSIK